MTLAGLDAFGLGATIGEPTLAARGAQGFIWKVQTTAGTYAVKQLQPWVDAPAVPGDVALQVAARDAGVPLPSPVLTADGRAVADRTRVYEWVDLRPPLASPVAVDRAAEAGDLLGRIHRLAIPATGATGAWYLVPPTEEEWRRVIADARARGVRSPWIDVVDHELALLLDAGRRFTVTPLQPTITCHADFCPANVLPSAADGRLVVLDWENAGPLAPDAELAAALLDWTTGPDGAVDLDAARALLAAHGGAVRVATQSFAMWVVTALNYLHVLLEHLTYEFDGNDPAFAETTLPSVGPDRVRTALTAIDALVRRLA